MRLTLYALALAWPLSGWLLAPASAEELPTPLTASEKMSQVITPTPEMWLYMQQLERSDDPAQAVRRKAEAKTAARQARLESMRWHGYSNSRPQVNPVPLMGTYSPAWASYNSQAYRWMSSYPIVWR